MVILLWVGSMPFRKEDVHCYARPLSHLWDWRVAAHAFLNLALPRARPLKLWNKARRPAKVRK